MVALTMELSKDMPRIVSPSDGLDKDISGAWPQKTNVDGKKTTKNKKKKDTRKLSRKKTLTVLCNVSTESLSVNNLI